MTRADHTIADEAPAAPQHYGTIVVVGGGCYGSYYVRQLRRAREREALTWERLIVVDHDEDCGVAREHPADLELAVSDWSGFFAQYLGGEARDVDAIVPSPLMPHLLFEWLEQRARERGAPRGGSVAQAGA